MLWTVHIVVQCRAWLVTGLRIVIHLHICISCILRLSLCGLCVCGLLSPLLAQSLCALLLLNTGSRRSA